MSTAEAVSPEGGTTAELPARLATLRAAVKYGALSKPAGRGTVRTRVVTDGGGENLVVEWIESGGPPVTKPRRQGFGARVLEQGLAGELAGKVQLDYRPAGLSCRIELPLHALEPSE